ncbi:GNAT family N-acetyltransferase [Bacillus altitudinis]|uniref:GNAT family N-acetyltransferase n=1 Tax=Bacillus altitudinis TaxID=293387 RepID=UPI001C3849CE|nr:GNAT family N-acetyltransferase [Bacillus altitudinis]MBV5114368.1 GNAT family N-acetyltransferase [Bacillus altitudinis]MBW2730532.1 GNAT family N-acetyltransferase [Bacillus altitudinis]
MNLNQLTFREAVQGDLDNIVLMLSDDKLGQKRERYTRPILESYLNAFRSIEADPNIELIVACDREEVVGVLQLTMTPFLTYQGGWRSSIEGVRTASTHRGRGIGTLLIKRAIQRASDRGCHMIQLTTDKQRPEARRFYEKLGFEATHDGMKLHLDFK